MAEIIDLLSSSPPPTRVAEVRTTSIGNKHDNVSFSDFDFDANVLDSPVDLDFNIEQSAKRRRLSPKAVSKPTVKANFQDVDAVFDLSSEADLHLPWQPKSQLSPSIDFLDLDEPDDVPSIPDLSVPEPRHSSRAGNEEVVEVLSDDDLPLNDPIITSSQLPKNSKTLDYSDRTTNILANLRQPVKRAGVSTKAAVSIRNAHVYSYGKATKAHKVLKPVTKVDDNILDSSQPELASNRPQSPEDKLSVQAKKTAKSRKTSAEKEAERERKRQEKDQKAADRQFAADIAEVNKVKTNKKIAAKEMQLDLPSGLKGKSVGNQIEEFMKEAEATVTFYDEEIDLSGNTHSNIGYIIKWKRKVESIYDEIKEEWTPIPKPKVEKEKHILVYLTAEDFCTLAAIGPSGGTLENRKPPEEHTMKANLDVYMANLRSRHPQHTIIVLIQGLIAYLKKSANAKNREYVAAVRVQDLSREDEDTPLSSSGARPSKKRKTASTVDLSFLTNDISDALQLHLQLNHRPLNIIHTTSVNTTAHQIFTLTQHLATRPYRLAFQGTNLAHASFCMDGGQIKTGRGDARETFILMLQEVNRVTVSMAHGVLSEGFEGPASLIKAFKDTERKEGKEASRLILKDVKKAMNKDGGLSDKPLGAMVSKRLYKVFMSNDEDLRDGIA